MQLQFLWSIIGTERMNNLILTGENEGKSKTKPDVPMDLDEIDCRTWFSRDNIKR